MAAALALLALEATRAGLAARRFLHLPRVHVSAEQEAAAFAEIPGLERVSLHTSDGLTLRGWFAPGKRRAGIIFVHGGGQNRLQLFAEARLQARRGFGVLVYDSRACGESDGDLTTWGDQERRDLAAAIDYVSSRPDVDASRLAALGFSVGGSTVAMTAARDPRLRAVVLFATWTSLQDELGRKFGKYGLITYPPALLATRLAGVAVDAVRPIDVIGAIHPRPLLMITGDLDEDTPPGVVRRLFEAAGEPKELWVLPATGHGDYLTASPVDYEARVGSFLEQALAEP